MDVNADFQDQGENLNNKTENMNEIDNESNDISQHNTTENPKGTTLMVNSNTEQKMSETHVDQYVKTCSDGLVEPLPSTSVNNDDLAVRSNAPIVEGVVEMVTENSSGTIDLKAGPNDDHVVPSHPSVSSPQENMSDTNLHKNKCHENSKASTSEEQVFDSQRETDTKSPEMLLEEVEVEVKKLNISGEELKPQPQPMVTPSKVVVNRQTESFKNLMAYDGDSDSEPSDAELDQKPVGVEKPKSQNKTKTKKIWRKEKDNSVSGTSDSESDSSASSVSSESESDGNSVSVVDVSDDAIRAKGAVKTSKHEQDHLNYHPDFLPPIPDLSKLNITSAEEFMIMGKVGAIIADLVTVNAIPGTPAFDLDSMLFIGDDSTKKPIGPIFDVLGQVSEPIYCVRFNTEEEIQTLGLTAGMLVYIAPKCAEFTKFVFVKELMKLKGTDASWKDDQETPVEMLELSDEEQEGPTRSGGKRKLDDSNLERHKRFEKTMNHRNTLNTRVSRLMDTHRNSSSQIRPNTTAHFNSPQNVPPVFNPQVPPPSFGQPSPYGYPSQGNFFAPSPPAPYGHSPNFGGMSPYGSPGSNYGAHPGFTGPPQFGGDFYGNRPPTPYSMGTPPTRWQQGDNFRRGRQMQRSGHRQSSDNNFTNNSQNFRGPRP